MSRRGAHDSDECGFLLVDKPAGPTSHGVVGWVRWALGVRRVGHCGTLDPAATGLLVVAVGKATKLAPYLTGQDKEYRARFGLGRATTTADAEGETLAERPCPEGLEAQAVAAVRGLVGTHALPPPAYSAVHVDGKRAHELARAGEAPVLAERPMTVFAAEPGEVAREGGRVEIEATLSVSKGTYIRSLAEALGRRLEVPAHLAGLHRTRSGALAVADPRAVRGLVAVPLEPGPRGAPRWAIAGPGGPHAAREAVGAELRARIIDPVEVVPLPVVRVTPGDSGSRALSRLASGQPIDRDDPGLPPWSVDAPEVAVAPAAPSTPGLVIVRVVPADGSGSHAALHPARVIIPPPIGS